MSLFQGVFFRTLCTEIRSMVHNSHSHGNILSCMCELCKVCSILPGGKKGIYFFGWQHLFIQDLPDIKFITG